MNEQEQINEHRIKVDQELVVAKRKSAKPMRLPREGVKVMIWEYQS